MQQCMLGTVGRSVFCAVDMHALHAYLVSHVSLSQSCNLINTAQLHCGAPRLHAPPSSTWPSQAHLSSQAYMHGWSTQHSTGSRCVYAILLPQPLTIALPEYRCPAPRRQHSPARATWVPSRHRAECRLTTRIHPRVDTKQLIRGQGSSQLVATCAILNAVKSHVMIHVGLHIRLLSVSAGLPRQTTGRSSAPASSVSP